MALEMRVERLRSVAVSFLYFWKQTPPQVHNITIFFISPAHTHYEHVHDELFSQQDFQTYTSVLSDILLGKWRTIPFAEPMLVKMELHLRELFFCYRILTHR